MASVSDFIGTWTCVTAKSKSITCASNGVIDTNVMFPSFYAAYRCPCFCGSKPFEYCCQVGSKFDIVGAWK